MKEILNLTILKEKVRFVFTVLLTKGLEKPTMRKFLQHLRSFYSEDSPHSAVVHPAL